MKTSAYSPLVLLLIVGGSMAASGQSRFALSVNVAPIYTHTDFNSNLPFPDLTTHSPTTIVTSTSNGINYLLGLSARYSFSPKWSASTGIWATHSLSTKTNFDQNGISILIPYHYSHPFTNAYKVPVLMNYQSSIKRLSPYFSAGASLDFRGISYVDLDGSGREVPVKFGKAVVITPLVGVGAIYRLTTHFLAIAQPTIQYNVQPHANYSYYHAYQLSLQTQLLYQF